MLKEYERKCLLNKEKYSCVIDKLTELYGNERKIQINYYYDTVDCKLASNGETLRIRQIENELKLEYKHNKRKIDGVRICDEYTKNIISLPKTIKGSVLQYKSADEVFYCLGTLITERTNFEVEDVLISLDKNYYLGTVDYEIEIESEGFADLPHAVKVLEINFNLDLPGKYSRFIKTLISQKE